MALSSKSDQQQREQEASRDEDKVERPVRETRKRSMLLIKGRKVAERDYRAALAFLVVGAFIYVVIFGSFEAMVAKGPLAGAAVAHYFHVRNVGAPERWVLEDDD